MPSDVAFPYMPIGGASEKAKRRICNMNRRNWKRIMLVSIVLLAVVISGFSAMTHAMAPQPTTRAGGVLKIAMQQDLPNFNYFDINSNTVWKSNVIGWNFESIMGMDKDGSAYPLLASKVDFNTTTLTATIHLRHNVTFQDGTPMTAKDVIFSYCALRQGTTVSGTAFTVPFDDNGDGKVSFSEIQNHVKYVDTYTVKISAKQPYSYFFLGTLGLPIIPEHIWKNHLTDVDGQGTSVDANGYTHGVVDTSWNSDPAATIGTGAWMYAGGVKDSYRVEKPYNGYWGKDFKTPNGFPFWNPNVTEMMFKVYSNLDTAVLALQTGDVDYIAWSIQPGKVPILEKDPNIDLHFMADNGYFYLAFNEKKEPSNYIAFRHAVSHVIDKATAVQRYLGGFGRKGDSVEPPFFDAWYNSSVQRYPYDLNKAKEILDGQKVVADNGFVEQDPAWGETFKDVNGDGWRDLPDGSPMPAITLFTPPADYDPVRIKVGQGIAQNLRSLGINIQAKPVDFDTLVAYMQSYNYVMLELGWSLSADPIGNIADIFGPKSIQNTWGWWNASDPNPYYVNAGGVQNTRADKMSQDYATLFNKTINKAMTTFNVDQQIKYTKWAQDIIAKATVVNVLYYRLNVEATRKSWEGWVEWMGSVFNGLSLGMLHASGAVKPPVVHPGEKLLDAALTVPGRVLINGNGTGMVYVMDNNGMPLSGANVALTVNSSLMSVTPTSGTTNSNGVMYFKVKGIAAGIGIITATVSKEGYPTVNKTATINVVNPITPALSATATASKMSLSGGDSTQVTVKVVDQNGNPVSGATVSVDPNLVGFGTVAPTNATTDSNGVATFTYHAPSAADMAGKYKNMHAVGKLVFTVSKTGYLYANTPVLQLITYNNNPSVWHIYRIVNASTYAVSPTLGWTTTIFLKAVGADGSPLANENIPITYSDDSYIINATTNVVTNATGYASFTVQFKPGLATKPIYIDFTNNSLATSVGDRLEILYYNGSTDMSSTHLYGGYISVSDAFINGDSSFTVHLYDQNNQPVASNVGGAGTMTALLNLTGGGNATVSGNFTVTVKDPVISNGMLVGGTILSSNLNGTVVKSSNSGYVNKTVNGTVTGVIVKGVVVGVFNGTVNGTPMVENITGTANLAVDMSTVVPIAAVVSGTTDGQLVDLDDESNSGGWYFNSAWYYTGIGIYSPYDNIATSGDFIGIANTTGNPYDDGLSTYDETGVVPALVANGTVNIGLPLAEESYRDLVFDLFVVPYGEVYLYIADPNWNFYQFNISGEQVFHSQAVVSRAMNILITSISTDPIATPGHPFNVNVVTYDQANNPVKGAKVTVYNNAKPWKALYKAVSGVTDANGTVTLTPTAPVMSSPSLIDVYAKASAGPTTYSVLEGTQISVIPPYMFVDVTPMSNGVLLGHKVAFDVYVYAADGTPLAGATVSPAANMGNVTPSTLVTNAEGHAVFTLDTSTISADSIITPVIADSITVAATMDGYNPASSTAGVVITKGYVPILSVGLADGAVVSTGQYTVKGYVYAIANLSQVVISVDGHVVGNATVSKVEGTVVYMGVEYQKYEWTYTIKSMSAGKHTITVEAIDENGMSSSQDVSVTAQAGGAGGSTTTPGGGAIVVGGMDLWLILTIILLIVVVIMGAMLAKKPKAPVAEEAPAEEEEPEEAEEPEAEEAPAEEEEETPEEGGEEE